MAVPVAVVVVANVVVLSFCGNGNDSDGVVDDVVEGGSGGSGVSVGVGVLAGPRSGVGVGVGGMY